MDTVVEVESIVTRFGAQAVHDGVSFAIERGTLVGLIGASGTGKSVLLREIIGLQRPSAGRVRLLGTDVWNAGAGELDGVRRRFGMMFQDGALFSSLSVAQNVAVPLREHTRLAPDTIDALVALRLQQAARSRSSPRSSSSTSRLPDWTRSPPAPSTGSCARSSMTWG
jgi:phospholipid/cholesterol/gamma-HCH transport system ATP-binding protein